LAAALLWVAGVTAGLAENNGSYRLLYDSPHITCRLTAKNQDQLRNLTLVNRVWASYATATAYRRVDNKKAAFDSWTRRSDGVANWKVWRTTLDPHSYNGVRKLCESEASVVGSFHDIDGTSHRPASSELVHLLQQRDVCTV